MIKHEEIPPYVETVSGESVSHTSIGVTHMYDFRLATQSSEVAVMIFHAAHQYSNSQNTAPVFHSVWFYKGGYHCWGVSGKSMTG